MISPRLIALCFLCSSAMLPADDGLIGHWPLTTGGQDVSGHGRHATPHNIVFPQTSADLGGAVFDGSSSWLEVPSTALPHLGTSAFSVACRVYTPRAVDDIPGDLVSRYDRKQQQGFHLALKSSTGVTTAQAGYHQLQFGIDQQQSESAWIDNGRPGNAILGFALATWNGDLYAGTCEAGQDETGHVYRFAGGQQWIDCGSPDQSNSVTALAEYRGQLYAATGKYRLAGSSLTESQNETVGGRVFRYDGGTQWTDCGQLPDTEAIGGLVVYRDQLYASSLYRPAGFFRYEGGHSWTTVGAPPRSKDHVGDTAHVRVEPLAIWNGYLWAGSYDGGRVYRFDGDTWEDWGQIEDNTQTYSFAVYDGSLYVGTWRSGCVYRLKGRNQWTNVGQLGEELEVMGMLVHNGRFVAGTLPLAEVYEYQGADNWKRLQQLDLTPDVRYRRAWAMAEQGGRVFCSTLPSGHVWSWRAGRTAMSDRSLSPGWHTVAAVRDDRQLTLYVDGKKTAAEVLPPQEAYDLSVNAALEIGRGPNDFFNGRLADVRLYDRALSAAEVAALSGQ